MFGIIFFIILIGAVEGIARAYEFFSPSCSYLKSDVFENADYFKKREVCSAETLVRYDSSPIIHYIPNQHFTTLNINSEGFRGDELIKEKSDDTYRIFVVGGSTTFGIGATSDNTTIPGFLQTIFNDNNPELNVQVINAGINGADSPRITYWIKSKLIEYNPDLVIIFDGANDAKRHWENKSNDPLFTNPEILENNNDVLFNIRDFHFYRTPFVINKILIESPQIFRSGYNENKIYHFPEVADIWINNHKKSCELGNKNNFETVVLLQPHLGSGNKILSKGETEYAKNNEALQGYKDNFQSISEQLYHLESSCTKVVDMRNTFDNISDPIFIDLAHTSDLGNEIIADNMYKIIFPIVSNS